MSFKVLVVPEDPTNNGYILQPLVTRMLEGCGRPQGKVTVLTNPKTAGYDHAKAILIDQVFDRYSHYDLLLFLCDADGKDRTAAFANLEAQGTEKQVRLICCAAIQEVETWLLAGHTNNLNREWAEVRADVSVKENVFDPFMAQHGDSRRPGGGRDLLMKDTLQNYAGLLERCPELRSLENRIREIVEGVPE